MKSTIWSQYKVSPNSGAVILTSTDPRITMDADARERKPGVRNGREYDAGEAILIDATSLGADDLAGTADDGAIREIEVFLNGTLLGSLSSGNLTSGSRYEFYQFNIPSDQPAGEYLLEAIAEDRAGFAPVHLIHSNSGIC